MLGSPDPTRLVTPATYGALASRGDLNPSPERAADGSGGGGGEDDRVAPMGPINSVATNAKLMSASLLDASTMMAVGGPTHDDQPVFSWATAPAAIAATPHGGQPIAWDFDWLTLHAKAPL